MKVRILRIDFENRTVCYRVTANSGETLFGDFTTTYPESAVTPAQIRAAILPTIRTVGASLRADARAKVTALADIETDPLP